MQLFIDTANIDEIRSISEWGVLDGVTTNPTLIAREGKDFKEVIEEIVSIVNGPISAEVMSLEADRMVDEAVPLSRIHQNIVIKVPFCEEGLKAAKRLRDLGIKTNITLIFSAGQALLAAKVGASFVSPFLGRLDDIGRDGLSLVAEIVELFENDPSIDTKIIAASIRNPLHVIEAAKMGCDVATIPCSVFRQLLNHPLTEIGIDKFLKDWEQFCG